MFLYLRKKYKERSLLNIFLWTLSLKLGISEKMWYSCANKYIEKHLVMETFVISINNNYFVINNVSVYP